MIYTISEWAATILECALLFWFLIAALSYKELSAPRKFIGTSAFFVLLNSIIFFFNYWYVIEGWYTLFYMLVLFLFCRLMLKQKFWQQGIVILLAFMCIYVINLIVMHCSAAILNVPPEAVLTLRNPVRVFLLFITKAALFLALYILSFLYRKRKIFFSTSQCIVMFCVFLITFCIGVTLERIQLEGHVEDWESAAIVICLIVINCLLFFVMYLISAQNHIKMNHALLKIEMQNEKEKLEESILWSKEIETLRHDLKNHLFCITEFIKGDDSERALQYIGKLSARVQKDLPNRFMTSHPALNAILNLKKMICVENEIDLKCFIIEELPEFDDVDLCIILSNLLDNAIEAEKKEDAPEICLSISTVGGYLRIILKNKISDSVLEGNKALKTSKQDKKLHGFGILSVSETVQKNDGMQEFYEEKGWFVANILLKIQDANS